VPLSFSLKLKPMFLSFEIYFKIFCQCQIIKYNVCTYAKESAVISSTIYHTAKWVVRVPGLVRLAFYHCVWGGFYPVRDIILHHYHHRHHHRDGSHLDILRLSLTHYPTYAHWRHSVSQSVSRSVGPCDSFGFMLGFPVRAPFWIAHELSGDPVESCVYLQRDKWFLI